MCTKCSGRYTNGDRCRYRAKSESEYCGIHLKSLGECPVCYDSKQIIPMKTCKHGLCYECTEQWSHRNSCPLCRAVQCKYVEVWKDRRVKRFQLEMFGKDGPSNEEYFAYWDALGEHRVSAFRFEQWYENHGAQDKFVDFLFDSDGSFRWDRLDLFT